jgi:hypothetical protein
MSSPILRLPEIIQQDFTEITTPIPSGNGASREHIKDREKLVALAVARVFLLLVSLVAVCTLVKKFKISTLVGLVACHELFTLAHNQSRIIRAKNSGEDLLGVFLSAITTNASSLVQGKGLVHPLAEGTLFPSLWSKVAFQNSKVAFQNEERAFEVTRR